MTRFSSIPVGGHFSFPKSFHAVFVKTSDRHFLPRSGAPAAPPGGHRLASDTVVDPVTPAAAAALERMANIFGSWMSPAVFGRSA